MRVTLLETAEAERMFSVLMAKTWNGGVSLSKNTRWK